MNPFLENYLVAATAAGARILSAGDTWAVIAKGRPVNHVLHLLITVFTCTGWAPAWLLQVAFGGEKRLTVTATPTGILEQKQPMEFHRQAAIAGAAVWGFMLFVWMCFIMFVMVSGSHAVNEMHSTVTTTTGGRYGY